MSLREYRKYYAYLDVRIMKLEEGKTDLGHRVTVFWSKVARLVALKLDFSKIADIQKSMGSETDLSSLLQISNYNDAARLGIVRDLALTLIPKDPSRTIDPFNNRYNTNIQYNVSVGIKVVTHYIYASEFVLGEGDQKATYVVEPASLKERRRKKTAPRYTN